MSSNIQLKNVSNLMKILLENAYNNRKNCNEKHQGKRYNTTVKLFSTYIYLIGGKLLYEVLSKNLAGSLPSVTTVHRELYTNISHEEGKLLVFQLKEFLLRNKYPCKVWVSEDGTAISGKIEYNAHQNVLVGFTLPLCEKSGIPKGIWKADTAQNIFNAFKNGSISKYAYIITVQPLAFNAPPFCLCAFSTDNRFTSQEVVNRWKHITEVCLENGIEICGFSSDGDTRLLKAMKFRTEIPKINLNFPWFQTKLNSTDPLYIQDTVHIGTKLRNCFLNKKINLTIGNYIASKDHLATLIETVSKDQHLLCETHLSGTDNMNFESVEKISHARVQECLAKYVAESQATVAFLKVIRYVLDSFLEKSLKVCDRIYYMWYAVNFLRLWRHFIRSHSALNLSTNFITLNAYSCIELNAHALILACQKFYSEPHLFQPWLWSSQPCEKLFRATRSMTSTFSTVVNFSMLGILQRLHKFHKINEIMSEIDDEINFPRENTRKMGSQTPMEETIYIPSINEIADIVSNAKQAAVNDIQSLGITIESNEWETVSILHVTDLTSSEPEENTSKEAENEADFMYDIPNSSGLNNCDDMSENEDRDEDILENLTKLSKEIGTSELNLKDYSKNEAKKEARRKNNDCDPCVKYEANGKILNIRKTTLCWLLSKNIDRISSDRLLRFVGNKKRREKNSENNNSKHNASFKNKKTLRKRPRKDLSPHSSTNTEDDSCEEMRYAESEDSDTLVFEEDEEIVQSKSEVNDVKLEHYYAVAYNDGWYIGRVVEKVKDDLFQMKYLKYSLDKFIWPRTPDIHDTNIEYIFYGPVCLDGNDPFYLKRSDKVAVEKLYKDIMNR
ncbi:uncharacterized protein LOC116175142 isoform X1 [Photinus pyralis]|nr:uncharacterized protein LOC116175142 isoform X1 [Photinus pyralis]